MGRFHSGPRTVAPAVAVALCLCAQAAPHGQDQPRFRAEVDVTSIDVIVVDDDGRPILNLQPVDFDVKIDGVSRRVATAEWIPLTADAAAQAGRPAVASLPAGYSSNRSVAGGRLIVLAIDRNNIRVGGMNVHRDALNRFIDRLEPSDRIAVVAGGLGRTGSIPFTMDHEAAKAAVSRVVGQRGVDKEGAANVLLRELLIARKDIDAPKTVEAVS